MHPRNRILTMLACLNCVHTTHAVESTSADTQIIDQDNGQESVDALKAQYQLHNLVIGVGRIEEDVEKQRDAGIQIEKIMQKVYAHKKDELSPNDPRWFSLEELIDRGRNTIRRIRLESV